MLLYFTIGVCAAALTCQRITLSLCCWLLFAVVRSFMHHFPLFSDRRFIPRRRICSCGSYSSLAVFSLLLSGDIESNPGPRTPKHPCSICSRAVKQHDPAVLCDECGLWTHNKCSGLSDRTYKAIKHSNSDTVWICLSCSLPSYTSSFFDSSLLHSDNSFEVLHSVDDNTTFVDRQVTSTPCKTVPSNSSLPNKLKVISINVNSLRGKVRSVEDLIHTDNPDIILCKETKIDSSASSAELFTDNYSFFVKIII